VADAAGSPLPEIRELNPALLKAVAPAGYAMRVPKASGAKVVAGLNAVPAAQRLSWRLHRVSDGDTVAAIARRYAVPPSALAAANSADLLADPEAGTVLAIPVVYREARPAVRKKTTSGRHATRKAGSRAARTMLARSGAHRAVSTSRRSASGKSATRRVKRSAPVAASQVAATRQTRRATAN
jgi:membrane-bound lytic murein transglycosylase D